MTVTARYRSTEIVEMLMEELKMQTSGNIRQPEAGVALTEIASRRSRPTRHESRTRTVWIVLFWSLPFVLSAGAGGCRLATRDRIAYEEMSGGGIWLAHRVDSGSTRFLVRVPAWAVQIFGFHLQPHAMGFACPARPVHDQRGMAAQTSLGDETRGHPPVCRCPLATLLYFNA